MGTAQVRPYQGDVGRPPMSTPIASAATALSLDGTGGNHTDDFAERMRFGL